MENKDRHTKYMDRTTISMVYTWKGKKRYLLLDVFVLVFTINETTNSKEVKTYSYYYCPQIDIRYNKSIRQ